MPRRGDYDRSKERFWRQVLRRWGRSGLSVGDFCAAEGLGQPSFYAWRRTLAARDQLAAAATPPDADADKDGQPLFVPLGVVSKAATPLELVLGDDRVVRVPDGFDAATLRRLLAVLKEVASC